ncbi:hypothetical protein ACVKXF_000636 [Curtobacterium sp. PvP017]
MDRFRRLPLPALLPMLFVVLWSVWFATGLLTGSDDFAPFERAIGAIAYATIATAGFGIAIAIRRRRAGGTETAVGIQRAVRTGVLPESADPVVWARELDSTRWRYRNNRVVVPIAGVLFAAFSVWAALVISPWWWLLLVLFTGMCAYSVWETRRALRNIDHLLTTLRGSWTVPQSSSP